MSSTIKPVFPDGPPRPHRRYFPPLLLLSQCVLIAETGADTFQKVLLSDDVFNGQKISFVADPPEINDQGKVVFSAFMSPASKYHLFTGSPGSLQVLATEDGPAAGVPGQNYDSFNTGENQLTIGPSGAVLFSGDVDSPNANDSCLWFGTPGNVQLIGREDGPTPDLAGEFFGSSPFSGSDSRLNAADKTVFRATRKIAATSSGIWAGAPASPAAAALTGTTAPDVSANYGQISKNCLSQTGRIAFYASLVSSADKAVFAGMPGSLQKVFRFGEACQGIPGAVYGGGATDGITMEYFNNDTLTYSMRISGAAINSANDAAVWAGPSASPQLIMQDGAPLPSALGGGNIDSINNHNINALGNFLVLARKLGSSSYILWWSETVSGPDNWIEVARVGAPLTGLGVDLSTLFTTLAISLSDNGDVIFYGIVSGTGVTTANDLMLMRWSPSSQTVGSIVREGDSIEVAPGDFRTVTGFEFSGGNGPSASMSCGVNGTGQVALSITFSDNTKGVIIANPDGPVTGFAQWAAAENLPAGKDGPTDDANDDGVANAMAYYAGFGGGETLKHSDLLQWTWNGTDMTAELRHLGSVTDVVATLEVSTTLTGTWSPGPVLGISQTSGNIETLSASIPHQGDRGFARVAFTIP